MTTAERLRLSLSCLPPYDFHGFPTNYYAAASSHLISNVDVPVRHPLLVSADCCLPSRRRTIRVRRTVAAALSLPRRKENMWRYLVPCTATGDVAVQAAQHRPQRREKMASETPPLRSRLPGGSRSSCGDEGAEALVSRRRRRRMKSAERGGGGRRSLASMEGGTELRDSFAEEKLSADPRGDFLRSMAEMVLENRIIDSAGLEQLLGCFLSLNSRQHHAAIVAAFEDVWSALFPAGVSPPSTDRKTNFDFDSVSPL